MADIVLITAPKPVRLAVAFIVGVAIATTAGVLVALLIATLLGGSVSLGDPSNEGSTGNVIQYVLVGLLIAAAVKSYVQRSPHLPIVQPHPAPRLYNRRLDESEAPLSRDPRGHLETICQRANDDCGDTHLAPPAEPSSMSVSSAEWSQPLLPLATNAPNIWSTSVVTGSATPYSLPAASAIPRSLR